MQTYYYNYPFKEYEHNLSKQHDVTVTQQEIDSTLSTIPVKYDSSVSINKVTATNFEILANDDSHRNSQKIVKPFKMKVFQDSVKGVISEGAKYDFNFNYYFELDGYIEHPYYFEQLGLTDRANPQTVQKSLT